MTGGFTFEAYPAEYRSSGEMTFIVNQDGTVYQKDLGKNTESLGKSMRNITPIPLGLRSGQRHSRSKSQTGRNPRSSGYANTFVALML